jgi:hypothetical protein
LLAAGNGWIAVAQGDSSFADVRFTRTEEAMRIRWPHGRFVVSEQHYRQFIEWMRIEGTKTLSSEDQERFLPRTRREHEARVQELLDELLFAQETPSVTDLLGDGPCLLLAGFEPDANIRGRGISFVVLDVISRRLLGVVSLPRRGSRGRHFAQGAVFSTYLNEDALWVLERFPLPQPWCRW